jgi:cyclic-di-AMP phosphodiesterase PgpH
MRIFPVRKVRPSRVTSLKTGSWTGRIGSQLSHGDVSLRLAICLLFLIALVFGMGSWSSPFPHRLGDNAPNGLLARIDFERINLRKTDLAQLERENRVPPVFRHSAHGLERLRTLPDELRKHLFEVVSVSQFTELSAETRAAFGWVSGGPRAAFEPPLPEFEADWQQLRSLIGPVKTAERKIDEIVGEVNQFTVPLRQTGVLDPAEVARQELRLEAEIAVVSKDEGHETQTYRVADVLLIEMLKTTGNLGGQWKSFAALKPQQTILERWLMNRVAPTLEFDPAATNRKRDEAKLNTPPVIDTYKRGALLVAPGTDLDAETLAILKAQYDSADRLVSLSERALRLVTVLLLLIVLVGMNGYYLTRNEPRLATSVGRLTVYLATVTVALVLSRWLSFDPWRAEVVPLLCIVMVLAIAYNQVLASLTGFSMTLALTLATGRSVGEFVVLMSAVAASVVPLHQVSNRMKLVKVGFWAAVTYLLVTWGVNVLESQNLDSLWTDQRLLKHSLQGAGWCFLTGFIVSGSLPFIEQLFGVVTDISLLELSDVSQPLLQELVQRAPGTYSHSNSVAAISETAADAIGANGLLCRVGAYYHDIGKMLKPHYFVENMTAGQVSRHESLNPQMSALVIIGHVKDGVELARQHNLPVPLIDFIEQHHGTTLVEYFFHAATKQAEAMPDHRFDVQESAYRYPGPKPQSREAAVMMVADACESACRTVIEPTPKRIETLIHEIAMKKLLDGQFDESELTLSELALVEDSLKKSLIGIHHGRIKYPEQKQPMLRRSDPEVATVRITDSLSLPASKAQ